MAVSSNIFRILHVTDIHDSIQNIQKLKEKLTKSQMLFSIDCILVSGDVTTMPMQIDTTLQDNVEPYEKLFNDVIQELSTINSKIIYIPGNHDPPRYFESEIIEKLNINEITQKNIQKNYIRLTNNLIVAGFGGSAPGFYSNNEMAWDGLPFKTKDAFDAEFKFFIENIFKDDVIKPEDNIILMTHMGPINETTAMDRRNPQKIIICGSSHLQNCIEDPNISKRIIMNIHGHTHNGHGRTQVGDVTIINPGALQDGRYGLYELQYESQKWVLTETHLITMTS